MSLAHANFSASNHIRYGQDFYDERMQASVQTYVGRFLCSLSFSPPFISLPKPAFRSVNSEETFSIIDPDEKPDADSIMGTCSEASLVSEKADLESEQLDAKHGATTEAKPDTTPPVKATAQDPLKWFGILTPPALRSAQDQFKHVVLSTVPNLANISHEMQVMEIEIRRTRKKILKLG